MNAEASCALTSGSLLRAAVFWGGTTERKNRESSGGHRTGPDTRRPWLQDDPGYKTTPSFSSFSRLKFEKRLFEDQIYFLFFFFVTGVRWAVKFSIRFKDIWRHLAVWVGITSRPRM